MILVVQAVLQDFLLLLHLLEQEAGLKLLNYYFFLLQEV